MTTREEKAPDMTDDAGRGRLDPTADPATTPGLRPDPTGPVATGPVAAGPAPAGPDPKVKHSRTGVLWTGLILSALVLLFLLVFIIQNDQPVLISFFALEGVLPSGVALLLAAIAGILLGAIPGTLRILQLRRAARRGPR